MDEKFCVTSLLCDPGWYVYNPDVHNKWDDNTHTYIHRRVTTVACFVVPEHRVCARWSEWGGRFIPDVIVGVYTLSILASSRVAYNRATEDNYYPDQHNTIHIRLDQGGPYTDLQWVRIR